MNDKYEENKKAIIIIALWLLAFALIYTALVYPKSPNVVSDFSFYAEVLHIRKFNLYELLFKEPFEIVFFQFKDGWIYGIDSRTDYSVQGDPAQIVEYFIKEEGRKIEDIEIIIHNHFSPAGFSPIDMKTYHYLKGKGFKGKYKIYYTALKSVRDLEE